MQAIVNFRTMQNGSRTIKRHQSRGYWRVLIVRDPAGPLKVNSHNVIRVVYKGPEGIFGVSARSSYDIDPSRLHAIELAYQVNGETV